MTVPPPDGSRDRRIEDPSNLWLIHPLGRLLLPRAIAAGVSANAVSVAGLVLGIGAALAYARFAAWPFAILGLALSIGWLVADGLDGMVARATGTAGPLGRVLDGVCDHGVFILIYVALALTIGTAGGWLLASIAGAAHALQASLYEGERARFHRRIRGVAQVGRIRGAAQVGRLRGAAQVGRLRGAAQTADADRSGGNPVVRAYDWFAGSPDRLARPFERELATAADRQALAARYGRRAVQPMRLLSLETANVRVLAIFVACLAGDPRLFWWFEIGPLTVIALAGLAWHRRVEQALCRDRPAAPADAPACYIVKEQGQ